MTDNEYEFLTGQWRGVRGAGYNQTYEFCQEFGWITGVDREGTPLITPQGYSALDGYRYKYGISNS